MGHQVQDLHHYQKPFADRLIGPTNQSPKMTLVMQPAKKKKKKTKSLMWLFFMLGIWITHTNW